VPHFALKGFDLAASQANFNRKERKALRKGRKDCRIRLLLSSGLENHVWSLEELVGLLEQKVAGAA
jgi:hypothetical protein